MIIGIENVYGEQLRVSHFDEEGEIKFLHLPIPPSERFIWEEYNPNEPNSRRRGTPDPDYTSWDGKPVKKVRTNKINKYRIQEILKAYQDGEPEMVAPLFDSQEPKKFYLDIETEIVDGFPDAESAKTPVTSISFISNISRHNVTFGLKDLTHKQQARIENNINRHFSQIGKKFTFTYQKFDSEHSMLSEFFNKTIKIMPVLTGWNFIDYDWKYLINRAKKLNINPASASPSGKLIGKNNLPQHRLIVDYMEIYKKWDRVIKIKESNKLDYVSETALGIKKLEYPGSLKELYEKDFENFILYNAIDTNLILCIDEKLQTMLTFFKLANISQVEINRVFSPVWVTEVLMSKEFLKRRKVFVWNEKDTEHVHYEGAYVKEPIKGLHKDIACYDFASLYPNTMMQWGISPESFKGLNLVESNIDNYSDLTKTSSGAFFDQKTEEPILKVILKDFYGKRKTTKKKYIKIKKEIDLLKKKIQ